MKLRCIGFTATTFEGKRYVKVNTLSPIEEGRGKGDTVATVNVDPSQEAKLNAASLPFDLEVIDQAIRMAKAGDRQVPQVFFTNIECRPVATAQPLKPVQAA